MLFSEDQKLKFEALEKHLAEQLAAVRAMSFSASCQGDYTRWAPLSEEVKVLEKRHDFVKQLIDLDDYWEGMLSTVPSSENLMKLQNAGCVLSRAREALTITEDDAKEALNLALIDSHWET